MTAVVLPPREAWSRIAPVYDAAPNPLVALEQRTLAPLLGPLQGKVVADVAAGTGRWTRYCAARGARALALDFCDAMLRGAPRPAILADAHLLPLPDACVDLAICAFGLGYAPDCLAELARITRPGGAVFVSDVHPEALRRGWTRTFRAGGEVIEAAHHACELEHLTAPGLELVCRIEPRLGPEERTIFEAAGKLADFETASRHAAIFVAQWRRSPWKPAR